MGRKDELDGAAVQDATTGFLERLLVKSTRIVSVSCDFLLNPTSKEDTSAYSEAFEYLAKTMKYAAAMILRPEEPVSVKWNSAVRVRGFRVPWC